MKHTVIEVIQHAQSANFTIYILGTWPVKPILRYLLLPFSPLPPGRTSSSLSYVYLFRLVKCALILGAGISDLAWFQAQLRGMLHQANLIVDVPVWQYKQVMRQNTLGVVRIRQVHGQLFELGGADRADARLTRVLSRTRHVATHASFSRRSMTYWCFERRKAIRQSDVKKRHRWQSEEFVVGICEEGGQLVPSSAREQAVVKGRLRCIGIVWNKGQNSTRSLDLAAKFFIVRGKVLSDMSDARDGVVPIPHHLDELLKAEAELKAALPTMLATL